MPTGIPLIGASLGTKLWVMREEPAPSSDEVLATIIAHRAESVLAMSRAHAAMEILYHRHARPLRAYLAARVNPKADADDVHQVAWQQVWHRLPGSFTGGSFRAWLFEIARNAAIDHGRKMRPHLADDLESRPDPRSAPPEAGLVEQSRREALQRCLERLEPRLLILVRARLAGADYTVICQEQNLNPGRAHKMYHQAKKQLQSCVERELR